MNSLILRTVSRFLLCLMLAFSWWVLFRGHNAPGGGFIAGLIATCAFALYLIAYGIKELDKCLFFPVKFWLILGISFIIGSGCLPVLLNKPFLTSLWMPFVSFINTPLLFDIGVYIVVWSSILVILLSLESKI